MGAAWRRGLTLGIAGWIGAVGGSLWAQDAAPAVLRVAPGPRAAGLGGGFVGGDGPDVVFVNPAQIEVRPGLAGSIGWIGSGGRAAALAGSTKLGPVTVALAGQRVNDRTLTAQSLAGSVAAAATVAGFRLGAAVRYLEVLGTDNQGSGPAFDLGVGRDIGPVTLGGAVQNLGPEMRLGTVDVPLPTRITIGGVVRKAPLSTWFDLLGSGALSYERDGRLGASAAIELLYAPLQGIGIAVRTAVNHQPRRWDLPGAPPFTAGASFLIDRLGVDYSYGRESKGHGSHWFGLRIR